MHNAAKNIDPKNTILFAGAGLSMGLGLPSWGELIGEMGSQLGFEKDIFSLFGDHLMLAEYYVLEKGGIGKLRSWMDVKWHSNNVEIETSKAHEYIAKSGFPIIYTTNFDRWLEKAFDHYKVSYSKVVSVSDFCDLNDGSTQIVKFHGDFDDDNSLVLTQSSYMERLQFETPLDIKLRSDVLHRPVLFIGYSLSDINVRYLFYKLRKMWQAVPNQARPPSYIYMTRPNPVQERVLKELGITPIVGDAGDPAKGVEELLSIILENGRGS